MVLMKTTLEQIIKYKYLQYSLDIYVYAGFNHAGTKNEDYKVQRFKISRMKTHEYQEYQEYQDYQEFKISRISNLIRNFVKTPRRALTS